MFSTEHSRKLPYLPEGTLRFVPQLALAPTRLAGSVPNRELCS